MQKKKQPIGVFDSGIGGLTVLEKLIQTFPNEDFLYVADQGHCPYGTKSQQEVGDRVEKVARYLVEHGAKAIVIACNTASLQIARARAITDVPVISVIQPTCAKAVSLTKNKKVAVLATVGTIRSGKYQQLLQEAGVEYKNFHVLRHTMATQLLANGVSIAEVAKRLGHSKISHTLNLYSHAVPNYDEGIPDIISKAYAL